MGSSCSPEEANWDCSNSQSSRRSLGACRVQNLSKMILWLPVFERVIPIHVEVGVAVRILLPTAHDEPGAWRGQNRQAGVTMWSSVANARKNDDPEATSLPRTGNCGRVSQQRGGRWDSPMTILASSEPCLLKSENKPNFWADTRCQLTARAPAGPPATGDEGVSTAPVPLSWGIPIRPQEKQRGTSPFPWNSSTSLVEEHSAYSGSWAVIVHSLMPRTALARQPRPWVEGGAAGDRLPSTHGGSRPAHHL